MEAPPSSGTDQPAASPTSIFTSFLEDADFAHAAIAYRFVSVKTGKVLYEHHADIGMVPASTQKIITAATAFELLGPKATFPTRLSYNGIIKDGLLIGDLILKAGGDPSLGSSRYASTQSDWVLNQFLSKLHQMGINRLQGHVLVDESDFPGSVIPDGWIWQDIGNYYGAGAHGLNWLENQYQVWLQAGTQVGAPVRLLNTYPQPPIPGVQLVSKLSTGASNSGDQANIYPAWGSGGPQEIRGSIPLQAKPFVISGALPEPGKLFALSLESRLKNEPMTKLMDHYPNEIKTFPQGQPILTYLSPPLDSLSYWFLKKSINLYGEALIKKIGLSAQGKGSLRQGLFTLKSFWQARGVDSFALNMVDGSGLSPQNRVTAKSLTQVLLYARQQSWFDAYYAGFPVINDIKMKSGTIAGTVAYAGFLDCKEGPVAFSIMVNNQKGTPQNTRKKIWKLLNQLK